MPSDHLMHLLDELQLCSRQQVQACESDVRRLCHDLPEFDCVWLDVLVQRGILTPWQVGILQSDDPFRLQIGNFVLRDALGAFTFLAQSTFESDFAVLRCVSNAGVDSETFRQAEDLVERLDELRITVPDGVCLPGQLIVEDSAVYFASPYVPGYSADELLVRGGRLPWQVVAEVGRRLLTAMAWLEEQQLPHAHVTLRNVRISPSGTASLVAPFAHQMQNNSITYSSDLKLRDVETAAPELAATGAQADSQSDLYSLGCVLWELLTGRSTFLCADPVQRILKTKQKDVSAVRSLVPDCPEWMSRQIQSFTRRSPELRPASVESARQHWNEFASGGHTATRQLLKRMPNQSLKNPGRMKSRQPGSRWRAVLAATLMLTGFAAYGVHRGIVPLPVSLQSRAEPSVLTEASGAGELAELAVESERSHPIEAERTENGFLKMPAPDMAGVVVLQSGGVYEAADLTFAGVMHIETSAEKSASVVVPETQSWNLNAGQVVVSGVQIQSAKRADGTTNSDRGRLPLVVCRCDVLNIRRCVLNTHNRASGVRWHASSDQTGVVLISDTIVGGNGYGFWLTDSPSRCDVRNCLFTSSGSPFRLSIDSAASVPSFKMSHVTSVNAPSVVDAVINSATSDEIRLVLECGESAFAPDNAVIRVTGANGWLPDHLHVSFLLPERGNPTILLPGVDPVIYLDRSLRQLVSVSGDQVTAEALLIAKPIFADTTDGSMADVQSFRLIDYEGPKLSPRLPGVSVAELPQVVNEPTTHATEFLPTTGR